MFEWFWRFVEDETGATSIEYALIGLLITTVIVGSVRTLGLTLTNMFILVNNGFSSK
jgi:Flp pilus assembly pilin Flp